MSAALTFAAKVTSAWRPPVEPFRDYVGQCMDLTARPTRMQHHLLGELRALVLSEGRRLHADEVIAIQWKKSGELRMVICDRSKVYALSLHGKVGPVNLCNNIVTYTQPPEDALLYLPAAEEAACQAHPAVMYLRTAYLLSRLCVIDWSLDLFAEDPVYRGLRRLAQQHPIVRKYRLSEVWRSFEAALKLIDEPFQSLALRRNGVVVGQQIGSGKRFIGIRSLIKLKMDRSYREFKHAMHHLRDRMHAINNFSSTLPANDTMWAIAGGYLSDNERAWDTLLAYGHLVNNIHGTVDKVLSSTCLEWARSKDHAVPYCTGTGGENPTGRIDAGFISRLNDAMHANNILAGCAQQRILWPGALRRYETRNNVLVLCGCPKRTRAAEPKLMWVGDRANGSQIYQWVPGMFAPLSSNLCNHVWISRESQPFGLAIVADLVALPPLNVYVNSCVIGRI